MTEKIRPVFYAILGLLVLYVVHCNGERNGAAKEKLRAESAVTDASRDTTNRLLAELASREIARESTLARTDRRLRDARGEITRLRTYVVRIDSLPDSLPVLREQIAVRDSVIARQDTIIATIDSVKSIWQALAIERGELLRRALQERDQYRAQMVAWQKRAEPGIFKKLGQALPYMAGAVVMWEAIR